MFLNLLHIYHICPLNLEVTNFDFFINFVITFFYKFNFSNFQRIISIVSRVLDNHKNGSKSK